MSLYLRILLILGALLTLWTIAKRVKRNKILMQDAIFWLVLAVVLVIMALFPGLIIVLAARLGFYSASNFVFLVVIALVLAKEFSNSSEISMLRHKVEELTQEIALRDLQDHEDRDKSSR